VQVAGGELDDALALGVDGRASGQGTLKGRGIDAMHRRKERAELASDGGVAAVGGEGLSVEPGEAGKTEREGGAHRQRPERQRDRHRQQPREPAQRGDQRELAGTGALALRDADGDTARGSKHGGAVSLIDERQSSERSGAGCEVLEEASEVVEIGGGD